MQKGSTERTWRMSHHTQARTAEVNREDQGRDDSLSARSASGIIVVCVSGLSEVGMTPESLWHQFDVTTQLPLDWVFFEMLVINQRLSACLTSLLTLAGVARHYNQLQYTVQWWCTEMLFPQPLNNCLPQHNPEGYPHKAVSLICCYQEFTHILSLTVPQTRLMKWKTPSLTK